MDIGLGSTAVELLTRVAVVQGSISGPDICFNVFICSLPPLLCYKTLACKSYYNLESEKKFFFQYLDSMHSIIAKCFTKVIDPIVLVAKFKVGRWESLL